MRQSLNELFAAIASETAVELKNSVMESGDCLQHSLAFCIPSIVVTDLANQSICSHKTSSLSTGDRETEHHEREQRAVWTHV